MSDASLTSDASAAAKAFRAAPALLDSRIGKTTRRHGALLRTKVRARASGRPGPRRQTGDYRRNIGMESGRIPGGSWYALVGTNSPQGRRLELGFVGADSLGRVYNQPPFPHFGPAVAEVEPLYLVAIEADVDAVARMIERGR